MIFPRYNYGNLHEILSVLSIIVNNNVYYQTNDDGDDSIQGRKVALINSPMTGVLFLSNSDESNRLTVSKLSADGNSWKIESETSVNQKELFKKLALAIRDFNHLKKSRTASVPLPTSFKNILDMVGLVPKTATSLEKFDCKIVLEDNFDKERMALKAGQHWEVVSIKSLSKSRPTLLNACMDNVSVTATISGEALSKPSVVKSLLEKKGPKNLLSFLKNNELTLSDYQTSDFLKKYFIGVEEDFAKDIFGAFENGGEFKNFENLSVSKSNEKLVKNFLRDCASGHTPKGDSADLCQIGNVASLNNDGLLVVRPYNGDGVSEDMLYSCKIDTPSMTRHTPNKDGILVRKVKNDETKKYDFVVTIPFQIRIGLKRTPTPLPAILSYRI